MVTKQVGPYLIEFVTDTYVRVYRFGVILFSGTPGAALAYCSG